MASNQIICKCVALLAEAFGRKTTPATFEVYAIALADLTDQQVNAAATIAAGRCRFMPTPAELREFAGVVSTDDRGIIAWQAVERAIPLGPYKHVCFDDPCVNAAIRNLGGWVTFLARLTDAEGEKWLRVEFLKAYAAFYRSGVGDEAGAPLPGLLECEAIDGQLCQPQPVNVTTGLEVSTVPRLTGPREPYRPRIQVRGEPRTIGAVLAGASIQVPPSQESERESQDQRPQGQSSDRGHRRKDGRQ